MHWMIRILVSGCRRLFTFCKLFQHYNSVWVGITGRVLRVSADSSALVGLKLVAMVFCSSAWATSVLPLDLLSFLPSCLPACLLTYLPYLLPSVLSLPSFSFFYNFRISLLLSRLFRLFSLHLAFWTFWARLSSLFCYPLFFYIYWWFCWWLCRRWCGHLPGLG